MRRLLSLLAVVSGLLPAVASAHAQYRPFSTNRYLLVEFEPEKILLTYDITVGDLPAGEIRKRADDDGDGWLSENEIRAVEKWLDRALQQGLLLQLDGQAVASGWAFSAQWGEPQVKLLSPMRLRFQTVVACAVGEHRLLIHDRTELPVLEQSELLVAESNVLDQLLVLSAVGRKSHIYWEGGERPQPVEVRFRMRAEPLAPGRGSAPATLPTDELAPLKKALLTGRLGWSGWLWTMLLALLLGAGHALSPGHGKTIMAAYLVGSGGSLRHALVLGLTVTLAHVASVIALGLAALWASEKVLPERLAPWLELISGLLVLVVSCGLLWRRIQALRGQRRPHGHDHLGGEHRHPHSAKEEHGHLPAKHARPGWAALLSLGFSGGLVPCPSALVLLLLAIYNRQLVAGLLLILAFSLGLAATLVTIGILAVSGVRLFAARNDSLRDGILSRWLPAGSAVFLAGVGTVMTLAALKNLL